VELKKEIDMILAFPVEYPRSVLEDGAFLTFLRKHTELFTSDPLHLSCAREKGGWISGERVHSDSICTCVVFLFLDVWLSQ
jgi:hypothetical protein